MAKSNEKKRDFFWLSYSDLMTSLFFVMLVLFVLVYTMQNKLIGELKIKNDQYERLQQVEAYLKKLRNNSNFVYLPECKKYVIKDLIGVEIFNPNQTAVKPEYKAKAIKAGKIIQKLLLGLNKDKKHKFLIVIEGNMANFFDKRIDKDYDLGYKLSYERALAVYKLWQENGVDLRQYRSEVLISGSGFNGQCRESKEEYNKRFSIQIIPILGK
jgi:hypothetical protein